MINVFAFGRCFGCNLSWLSISSLGGVLKATLVRCNEKEDCRVNDLECQPTDFICTLLYAVVRCSFVRPPPNFILPSHESQMFVSTLLHTVIGGICTTLFVQNNRVMLFSWLVNEASQELQLYSFFLFLLWETTLHSWTYSISVPNNKE